MRVLSTSDCPERPLEEFRLELQNEFDVELSEVRVALFSLEPPSWINLIARAEWWQQGLAAIAALYVAELVKEAAKETWKNRSRAITTVVGAGNRLAKLASSISRLRAKVPNRTEIVISLPEPNEYFGTRLCLSAEDPELVCIEIALFIHYLPALSALIEAHKADNSPPATGYFISLLPNGNLQVSWYDGSSLQKHEQIILLIDEEV